MKQLSESYVAIVSAIGDVIKGGVGFAAHGLDQQRADSIAERVLVALRSLPIEQRVEAVGMLAVGWAPNTSEPVMLYAEKLNEERAGQDGGQ